MLLYVDKKKEKKRKIKICCLFFFFIFVCYANVIYFKTNLHQTNRLLSATVIRKKENRWFPKTNTLTLFEKQNVPSEKIILIPQEFNKENALTLALAFSKIKSHDYKIIYTPEITFSKEIDKIASVFFSNNSTTNIIQITTTLESIKHKIIKETFFPTGLNYKHAEKLQKDKKLMNALNLLFPPHPKIKDNMEREQAHLKKFIEKYDSELKEFLINNKVPIFAKRHFFLDSVQLCLKTNKKLRCNTENNHSLEYNLRDLLKQTPPDEEFISLLLLTSEQEITETEANALTDNTGLHFNYHDYNIFMIPSQNQLTKNKENSYILKQQAGFNPLYSSPDMHFYKFKLVEVNLNDNI